MFRIDIFMMFIFAIVIGLIIYFIITNTKSNRYTGGFSETSLDIIKERFAKGEIIEISPIIFVGYAAKGIDRLE